MKKTTDEHEWAHSCPWRKLLITLSGPIVPHEEICRRAGMGPFMSMEKTADNLEWAHRLLWRKLLMSTNGPIPVHEENCRWAWVGPLQSMKKLPIVTRPVLFHFLSWLLAGNSYMVTLWWCLTYTLIYLLVTCPPLTILTWPLESWWLFTNTCSFLAVTWTRWVSSTSPLLIYSSAWLVPCHALTDLSIVLRDVYMY